MDKEATITHNLQELSSLTINDDKGLPSAQFASAGDNEDIRAEGVSKMDEKVENSETNLIPKLVISSDVQHALDSVFDASLLPKDMNRVKRKRKKPTIKLFRGTFVHSTKDNAMNIMEKRVIGVDKGVIVFLEYDSKFDELVECYKLRRHMATHCITMGKTEFMMPGFVDAHCQPVHYLTASASSRAEALTLYNSVHNDRVAKQLFRHYADYSLASGTTTVAYDTDGLESTVRVLTNILEELPQRAFVGLEVGEPTGAENMQMLQLTKVEACLNFMESRKAGVILQQTKPLASWLQDKVSHLQEKYQLLYKTVLECREPSKDEVICTTKPQFLSNKAIILPKSPITAVDVTNLEKVDAKLVYCCGGTDESQNLSILNSVKKINLPLGLGSGAVGSRNMCMLDTVQQTHSQTKCSLAQLFYMATLGSAQALCMDHLVGNFEVGKRFDAILVSAGSQHSRVMHFPEDKIKDIFERFLLYGGIHDVTQIYISGHRVQH